MKKPKGKLINGFIVLDKPHGMGSTPAVAMVKRVMNAQKVGHGGTLDPLATGVLVLALGEATKLMPFILNADKAYDFTTQFGTQTTTDDAEGEALHTSDKRPTLAQIKATLPDFTGELEQLPPQFSAIKTGGVAAYDKARQGETVVLNLRPVHIKKLSLIGFTGTEEAVETASFSTTVSKGTYIRSLARDMGKTLGCYGFASNIRRTRVGAFMLEQAITEEELKKTLANTPETGDVRPHFLREMSSALDDIPAYAATAEEVRSIKSGLPLIRVHLKPGLMKLTDRSGSLVSIVEISDRGEMKAVRTLAH